MLQHSTACEYPFSSVCMNLKSNKELHWKNIHFMYCNVSIFLQNGPYNSIISRFLTVIKVWISQIHVSHYLHSSQTRGVKSVVEFLWFSLKIFNLWHASKMKLISVGFVFLVNWFRNLLQLYLINNICNKLYLLSWISLSTKLF